MTSLAVGAGLLGGGAALSSLGGLFGASSANRAGRKARDWYDMRTGEGMGRLGSLFYGYDPWSALLSGTSAASTPEQRAEAARRFEQMIGGPIFQQLQRFGPRYDQMQGAAMGRFDEQSAGVSEMARQALGDRMGAYRQGTDALMSAFDRGAEATAGLGRGLSALAGQWGAGREGIIRRDAGRLRDDLDARTRAQMTASGFGGTLEANQLAANARQAGELEQDALQRLSESQVDRRLGALGTQTALSQALLGQRTGLGAGLFGQAQQAADTMTSQELQNRYARLGQRAGYDFGSIGPRLGYEAAPLQAALGVQQGGVMNPWLGQSTSQFYPGASGAGNVLGSLGNAAFAGGSTALGNWMGQQQSQTQFNQLKDLMDLWRS